MVNVIEALELNKRFGGGGKSVTALSRFSIRVPQGGVYGILGPNGAGKSTLFRIALGLVRPDGGTVRVLERQPGADSNLCWEVGAMIETPHFFNYLTAEQTLRMLAQLRGTRFAFPPRSLLTRVGLAEAADRKVHAFSVGMKQRLGIASALISRPRLVILDEPTSGMDPIGIQELRHLIRELSAQDGITVVLASHQLDEVSRLCDRIAIMDQGRLQAEGPVAALLKGRERLRLTVQPIGHALALLNERAERDGDAVLVAIDRNDVPLLIASLVNAGTQVFEARWVKPSLEDVFLRHVCAGTRV
ncbi:MAG: ATP-binding cassette domain-containing protein [Steroidobacteraceae bacterium]